MNNSNGTPNSNRGDKNNHFTTEMKRVFAAFYKKPKTMLMVANELEIERANICRHVGKLKKNKSIFIVKYGICPISKCGGVQFLTTNSMLIDKPKK